MTYTFAYDWDRDIRFAPEAKEPHMTWEFVSLQQGIDEAGSPIRLLWKPGSPPWKPPVVDD